MAQNIRLFFSLVRIPELCKHGWTPNFVMVHGLAGYRDGHKQQNKCRPIFVTYLGNFANPRLAILPPSKNLLGDFKQQYKTNQKMKTAIFGIIGLGGMSADAEEHQQQKRPRPQTAKQMSPIFVAYIGNFANPVKIGMFRKIVSGVCV